MLFILFHNLKKYIDFSVILERSENRRFKQAKDPIKKICPKDIRLILKNIKKPSANYLFGSFALFRFRSTLLKDDERLKLLPLYKKLWGSEVVV